MVKLIISIIFFFTGLFSIHAQAPGLIYSFGIGNISADRAMSAVIDNNNNYLSTGGFSSTVDFDPGPGVYNLSSSFGSSYILKLTSSGNIAWAKQFSPTTSPNLCRGWSIGLDPAGNVYSMGQFGGTVDFDPGPGVFNLTAASGGMYISKLDASGNFVWAKHISSWSINQKVGQIPTDPSGAVYITGSFQGTVDFDPGPGTFNLSASGGRDIFLLKLTSAGDFAWAKQINDPGESTGLSVAIDATGNSYTVGNFAGTGIDLDPGPGSLLMDSTNGCAFILKLDPSGDFLWAKQFGRYGFLTSAQDIKIDPVGNLLIFGSFQRTADLDPGPGDFYLTSVGVRDVYVLKLNPSGTFMWAKKFGGTGSDGPTAGAVDAGGNIYISCVFEGTADLDPGSGVFSLTSLGNYDAAIVLLSSLGEFRAGAHFGQADHDDIASINIDASGAIYATGLLNNTMDTDPCPGISNLTSAGSQDIFIVKLGQPLLPSISITTPSSIIIAGQTAVVSSTFQNGGSNPLYQWLDSTGTHGWQNITGATASALNYVPVQTGDGVRCLLTSNASCTNNITGLSNIIIFTVNPVTAINPVPGNTYGIKQFPNPTSSIFYIDSLKLSDKWEMLELINMSGERLFSSSIANKIRISLNVKDLPAGQYVVILRRKNGSAYLKFIKQ